MAAITLTGGDKLARRLKEIAKNISDAKQLGVGFMAGSTYPNTSMPTATVAAIQEWGSARIPSRPFFRDMIRDNSYRWGPNVATALRINDYDATQALTLMGVEIKEELQDSIRSGNFAPLAESTIARKGFDKPLIDTSHMINSVDYRVT